MTAPRPRDREDLLLNLANALSDQPRASMEQLACMVGLSRATLCRHFASRDAMLQAMSEEAMTSAELAFARACPNEGPVEQAVTRLIDELLPIAELYVFVWEREHGDPALEARAQPLRASFVALFHQWQACGDLRVDLPAAWLVESMSALLRSAAAMIRSGRLARHDAVHGVFSLLWRGMSR